MIMIGHENIGVKDHTVLLDGIGQIGEKLLVILMGEENVSPFISSCRNMIKGAFKSDPQGSCHQNLHRINLVIHLS